MSERDTAVPRSSRRFSAGRLPTFGAAALVVGAVGLAVGAFVDPTRLFHAYLAAYAYAVSVAVGALLFLMIGHAMSAVWPLSVRRLSEAIVSVFPALALLFVPLVFGLHLLYPWMRPEAASAHARHILEHRAPVMNAPFFVARATVYLASWLVSAELLRRWSLRRDRDPGAPVLARAKAFSSGMLPVVSLSLAFASFDWLMSLSPVWYSTMFPVYYFAGGFLGGLALLTVAARAADVRRVIALRPAHYGALGRLLLAFVVFWAYAAYFQYMLIWAANKPEEVELYANRAGPVWGPVTLVLVLAQFVLPFFLLLGYRLKRDGRRLSVIAGWVLAAHYIDVHWLVIPGSPRAAVAYHWLDLAALLAVGGASVLLVSLRMRGVRTLPVHEPDLARAMEYESA